MLPLLHGFLSNLSTSSSSRSLGLNIFDLRFHYFELGTPRDDNLSPSEYLSYPRLIDNDYEVISWRSVFSLIQLTLFVCDVPQLDDRALGSDMAWFKHLVNSPWLFNALGKTPLLTIFNAASGNFLHILFSPYSLFFSLVDSIAF
jgi:hypothetical protein